MNLTQHARERLAERFPLIDVKAVWAKVKHRRTGRRMIKMIRRQCPEHVDVTSRDFRGCYYRVTQTGIVFVVAPPEKIVTVFSIAQANPRQF